MSGRSDIRDPALERAHFEDLAARQPELYWADRTAAGQRRREIRTAALMAAACPGQKADWRVLEIGCGPGSYTGGFADHTAGIIIALDVAPALLRHARTTAPGNARFVAASVEELPFPTGAFDAVVGNAILHHLRLERALPELLRVLRPGGRFCFAEPNILNPHVFLEQNIPSMARRAGHSPGERALVRWRLRRTLDRAGLVDVVVRPFDFLYPLTPPPLIPFIERLGRLLERAPLVAEIAGSLLVTARKAPG